MRRADIFFILIYPCYETFTFCIDLISAEINHSKVSVRRLYSQNEDAEEDIYAAQLIFIGVESLR
jgi:hypothetical protein